MVLKERGPRTANDGGKHDEFGEIKTNILITSLD
jgi:hypothetical protein